MAEDLNADEVFNAARRIAEPGARAAYLERACGGNARFRARIEALLRAYEEAGSFLESPAGDLGFAPAPDPAATPAAEGPGSRVGPYKLLQQIGEGGFGVVYMAEQEAPVRRRVALKVIQPGLDTRQVIARFEAERQALALMDHENIAKVLDAGATDSGRPYFVMELVHGVHITEFCDRNRLAPRARLALFIQVCRAVQHAHTKGVIHRDIKPTNVLVTLSEGRPVPKVIDFGIAKATGPRLTDKTLFTQFAQMIGTPLYMSPEQAEMTGVDVDTRSDVYSLGVLLYELLTGTTPMDKERLKEAAFDEVRRMIREVEPPRPSMRLSTMDEHARSVSAAQRRSDPRRLGHLVRGELDWIVMKALEKDRNRRYETVNGFAMDLERYLADEPVTACPPSALYRLRKLMRRHRGPVAAAVLLLLTLAGGIVGTGLGLVRAERARRAEADRADGERLAKERAEENLALAAESVDKYLGTVTDDPDLLNADFHPLRRKLLESAIPFLERIAARRSDDPAVEERRGRAHLRLALLRIEIADYEAAAKEAEAMREIFARLAAGFPAVPDYRHDLARAHHLLAVSMFRLGRREEAEARFRAALPIYERLVAEVPGEPDYRHSLSVCHGDLGTLFVEQGRREEASGAYSRALELQRKVAAERPGDPRMRRESANWLQNLASLQSQLGRHEEAETAVREAKSVLEKLVAGNPDDPAHRRDLAAHECTLGRILLDRANDAEAESAFRRAAEICGKLAADFRSVPGHRDALAKAHSNLGIALVRMGRPAEAETALREALRAEAELVADFPAVPEYRSLLAAIRNNLGNVLLEQGKREAGAEALREAVALRETLAADSPGVPDLDVDLGGGYCNLGNLARESGRPDEALSWYEKAIARLEPVVAAEPRLVEARQFLRYSLGGKADALDALGRGTESLAAREAALALLEPRDPGTVDAMYAFIDRYDELGRFSDALRLRERVLTLRRETLGPDDPETLGAMSNLAVGYENAGRRAEALRLREETLALMRAKIPGHPYTLITAAALARDLVGLDRGAEALPLIDEWCRRAGGDADCADLVRDLLDVRFRHFERIRDAAGCRETAEMAERLNPADAGSLYDAACYRAVTAAVLRASGGIPAAAAAEADKAMEWLGRAMAAGYDDLAHIVAKDPDLDVLREREDFRRLLQAR